MNAEPLGRDLDTCVHFAVRYAMHRATGGPNIVARAIRANFDRMQWWTKADIVLEIVMADVHTEKPMHDLQDLAAWMSERLTTIEWARISGELARETSDLARKVMGARKVKP